MENTAVSRLTKSIFFSQSIQSAGQVTMMTVLSISAYKVSGQESLSGLPHSILIFTPALTVYSMRLLMNKLGWRVGLALGYAGGAFGTILGLLAVLNNNFLLLVFAAMFLGNARGSGDLSRYAVGQMYESGRRARMIGRVVFASAIGGILGPLLSPWAGSVAPGLGIPPDAGIWGLAGVLYFSAAVFTLAFLFPDPNTLAKKNTEIDTEQNVNLNSSVWGLFKLPVVQLAVSAMAISQLVMNVMMVMTPLHIHKMHYGNEVIAYVISAHVLGMFGLSALTGYLIDRFGTIPMLFTGALVLISSLVLAPFAHSGIVLAVALFLLGLGWNFGYVAGSSLLSSSLPHNKKSKLQGISDSFVAFLAGTSSLGSGLLFAMHGYLGLSLAGIGVTVLLMILIYFLSLQMKHKINIH